MIAGNPVWEVSADRMNERPETGSAASVIGIAAAPVVAAAAAVAAAEDQQQDDDDDPAAVAAAPGIIVTHSATSYEMWSLGWLSFHGMRSGRKGA